MNLTTKYTLNICCKNSDILVNNHILKHYIILALNVQP